MCLIVRISVICVTEYCRGGLFIPVWVGEQNNVWINFMGSRGARIGGPLANLLQFAAKLVSWPFLCSLKCWQASGCSTRAPRSRGTPDHDVIDHAGMHRSVSLVLEGGAMSECPYALMGAMQGNPLSARWAFANRKIPGRPGTILEVNICDVRLRL